MASFWPVDARIEENESSLPAEVQFAAPVAETVITPSPHEDCAKAALQEAYRRGAEAAAAMAHQPTSSSVSAPNEEKNEFDFALLEGNEFDLSAISSSVPLGGPSIDELLTRSDATSPLNLPQAAVTHHHTRDNDWLSSTDLVTAAVSQSTPPVPVDPVAPGDGDEFLAESAYMPPPSPHSNQPQASVPVSQSQGKVLQGTVQPQGYSLSSTDFVATISQSTMPPADLQRDGKRKRSRQKQRITGARKRQRAGINGLVPVADHVVVLGKCIGSNPSKASLVYHDEVRSLLRHVKYEGNDLLKIKRYLHKRLRKAEGIEQLIQEDPDGLEIIVFDENSDEQPLQRPARDKDLVRDIKYNAGPKRKHNYANLSILDILRKKLQEREEWTTEDPEESDERRSFTEKFKRFVDAQIPLYEQDIPGDCQEAVQEEQDASVLKSVNSVWRKTLEQYVLRPANEDQDSHHESDSDPKNHDPNERNSEDQNDKDQGEDESHQEHDDRKEGHLNDTHPYRSGAQGRQVRGYDEWSEDFSDGGYEESDSDDDDDGGSTVSSLTSPSQCTASPVKRLTPSEFTDATKIDRTSPRPGGADHADAEQLNKAPNDDFEEQLSTKQGNDGRSECSSNGFRVIIEADSILNSNGRSTEGAQCHDVKSTNANSSVPNDLDDSDRKRDAPSNDDRNEDGSVDVECPLISNLSKLPDTMDRISPPTNATPQNEDKLSSGNQKSTTSDQQAVGSDHVRNFFDDENLRGSDIPASLKSLIHSSPQFPSPPGYGPVPPSDSFSVEEETPKDIQTTAKEVARPGKSKDRGMASNGAGVTDDAGVKAKKLQSVYESLDVRATKSASFSPPDRNGDKSGKEVSSASRFRKVNIGKDVVQGKGQEVKLMNQHFISLIHSYSPAYRAANSNGQKREVALLVIKKITNNGGRFFDCQGEEMEGKRVLMKVRTALKDASRPFPQTRNIPFPQPQIQPSDSIGHIFLRPQVKTCAASSNIFDSGDGDLGDLISDEDDETVNFDFCVIDASRSDASPYLLDFERPLETLCASLGVEDDMLEWLALGGHITDSSDR